MRLHFSVSPEYHLDLKTKDIARRATANQYLMRFVVNTPNKALTNQFWQFIRRITHQGQAEIVPIV